MLPEACQGDKRNKTLIKWGAVGVLVVIGLILSGVALLLPPVQDALASFLDWVDSLGWWGYITLGIVLAILNFPFTFGWMLVAMACGFLYGMVKGMIIVASGTIVGAVITYLILKKFAQKPAIKYVEAKGGYVARSILYELEEHQISVSLMVRAGPIPPGVQNAILAVSPMSVWMYTATSLVGFLVKEIPYVYIGTGVQDIASLASGSSEESLSVADVMLFLVGAIAVVALFIFIIWVSRKAMKNAKKLQFLEESAKYKDGEPLTSEDVEDDFTMLGKPLESAPFQVEDDPVLRFFGMAYDKKTALDSDSGDEEEQLLGGAGFI